LNLLEKEKRWVEKKAIEDAATQTHKREGDPGRRRHTGKTYQTAFQLFDRYERNKKKGVRSTNPGGCLCGWVESDVGFFWALVFA